MRVDRIRCAKTWKEASSVDADEDITGWKEYVKTWTNVDLAMLVLRPRSASTLKETSNAFVRKERNQIKIRVVARKSAAVPLSKMIAQPEVNAKKPKMALHVSAKTGFKGRQEIAWTWTSVLQEVTNADRIPFASINKDLTSVTVEKALKLTLKANALM